MEEQRKKEQANVDGQMNDHLRPSSNTPSHLEESIRLVGIEKQIFEIAKDLMKRHYILKISDLIKAASRCIKHERKSQILSAINSLVAKKVIFEGKAIHKGSVLDNPTRGKIFDVIVKEPGIYANKFRSSLDIDARSISLHLSMLKKFELIRSRDFGNNRVYFSSALKSGEFDYLYYYMHKKHVIQIFKMIIDYPSISFQDLWELANLDISRGNLLRKINILIEEGFLTAMHDSNQIIALNIHTTYKQEVSNYLEVQDSRFKDNN